MFANVRITKMLVLVLCVALSGVFDLAQAQTQTTSPPTQSPNPNSQEPSQQAPEAPSAQPAQAPPGGMVNPSQGPLQPVEPSTAAPNQQPAQSGQSAPPPPAQAPQPRTQQPLGTAVGQTGVTAGGPASRPAGNAIAPAKQKQSRSLLLKVGMIAAAGIAVGSVVALTRGTSSKPPGAK